MQPQKRIGRFVSAFILIAGSFFWIHAFSQVACGKIVPKETCSTDTTQSYAYYVPTFYDASISWPVIFVFEPGARGPLGVSVFASNAEKYGMVVICSNNSHNGPVEDMVAAANAIYGDVHQKFSVDEEFQVTSGFSGGARFAVYLAAYSEVIGATIACGAGYPATGSMEVAGHLIYFGIVGDADFNYAEMLEFMESLEESSILAGLSIFQGPHRWPPAQEIEQALLWIMLSRMKQNKEPVNRSLIARYNELMDSLYTAYTGEGDLLLAARVAENWQDALHGLSGNPAPKIYLQQLESRSDYQQMLTDYRMVLNDETEKLKQYIEEFKLLTLPSTQLAKPFSWWRSELRTLNSLAQDSDRIKAVSARRLIAALSVNCYYASQSMFETKRYENARLFTEIWKEAEPGSTSAVLMSARLHILENKPDKAMDDLEVAASLGITRSVIKDDTLFARLKAKKMYRAFLDSLEP